MEIRTMSDEQRRAIAPKYLRRLDRGEFFFDLFDDHAEVYFPKWGVAKSRRNRETVRRSVGNHLAYPASYCLFQRYSAGRPDGGRRYH